MGIHLLWHEELSCMPAMHMEPSSPSCPDENQPISTYILKEDLLRQKSKCNKKKITMGLLQ